MLSSIIYLFIFLLCATCKNIQGILIPWCFRKPSGSVWKTENYSWWTCGFQIKKNLLYMVQLESSFTFTWHILKFWFYLKKTNTYAIKSDSIHTLCTIFCIQPKILQKRLWKYKLFIHLWVSPVNNYKFNQKLSIKSHIFYKSWTLAWKRQ